MAFENRFENTSAQPHQGNAAIAQQAWGPQAHTEKPAAQPADAQQALNNGLAMVGNLYSGLVHGAETAVQVGANLLKNDGTAQAVGHLAHSVVNKTEQDRQEAMNNPVKHYLVNPALAAVGVARGVFNFECDLADQISHPLETVQKAVAPVAKAFAFADGMNNHINNFDVVGLSSDLQQIGATTRKAVNGVVGSLDYAVNASPDQKGELIGHYALPAVVGSLAAAKGMSALKAFGEVGEAGAAGGAEESLLQSTKSIVGKTLTKEMEKEIGKSLFGKHHEHVKGWHEKTSPVAEPVQKAMEGSDKANEAHEIAKTIAPVATVSGGGLADKAATAAKHSYLPNFEISGIDEAA